MEDKSTGSLKDFLFHTEGSTQYYNDLYSAYQNTQHSRNNSPIPMLVANRRTHSVENTYKPKPVILFTEKPQSISSNYTSESPDIFRPKSSSPNYDSIKSKVSLI